LPSILYSYCYASVDCTIEPTDDLVTEAAINTLVTKSAVNTEARRVQTRAQSDLQKREGLRTHSALPIVPLNAWPIDEIIQNQDKDRVLSEVRRWLQAGTRPDDSTVLILIRKRT
jgi:hypothetical protein